MSFVSANDHPNPDSPEDPLYYAPRSVRSIADPRSNATPQTRSDHLPPTSPLSRFDEMREEAFAKFTRPFTGSGAQTSRLYLPYEQTFVRAAGMEGDKIAFLDADKIGQAIAQAGKVSLYGIHFDYDKDVLRAESAATLVEIAKLLNEKPELRIEIVGHTDGSGTPDYNMDLSVRRAARVAAALTGDYGIEAGRLTSSGAGLTSPLAPNDTDEGRAKNRRVELVAR